MAGPPTKRRKIRPNNAIAIEKQKKIVDNQQKSVKKEAPVEKSAEKEKPTKKATETVIPKLSTPYMSASDSDETDDERRAAYAKKNSAPNAAPPKPLSDSDSEETDKEQASVKPVKKPAPTPTTKSVTKPKPKRIIKTPVQVSDSDSDDTETENSICKQQQRSASYSDETHTDQHPTKGPSATRKTDHLTVDRISFRKTRAYDNNLTSAENLKGRLNDLFVPSVHQNYFISDSDSETDSGEDYDSKEYPSWQRTLNLEHNQEKDPWPKQHRLGYSDKLKLEKRIKKICRREGMTFEQMQKIFSSSQRTPHIRFFQKIAKVFPEVSLHRLSQTCKEMYHERRNFAPWTEEEKKQLEELIKIHGRNATLISEHMNRSPKNINHYLYHHSESDKKVTKRWTKEEDEIIARAVSKQNNGRVSFGAVESLLKGTRTQRQIHARYYHIRALIQPDGTLQSKRKATPYEELRYLKSLMSQVREHRLVEESQVDYTKDRGFVGKKFYLKSRAQIKGFEKMSIKEILKRLIEKQNRIIQSRREEGLLGSDPDEA